MREELAINVHVIYLKGKPQRRDVDWDMKNSKKRESQHGGYRLYNSAPVDVFKVCKGDEVRRLTKDVEIKLSS